MSVGEQSTADSLGSLQGKGDKYTRLSLIEKKRQADLQEAIFYILNETQKYRNKAKQSAIDVMNIHVLTPNPAYTRADGINIGKEAQNVTIKTLHILEAKLNTLLQRKSEIQNHVKHMKDTINHYRLLRMQTDAAHHRFEDILIQTKHDIENHLNEATKVMEERDRILEKKDNLERCHQEEQSKFQEEYEEMGRFITEQNEALENALLQERKADRAGLSLAKGGNNSNNNGNANGGGNGIIDNNSLGMDLNAIASDLTLEEEVEMAKKVGSLTSFMQSEQSSLTELREKIATYESMFEQLKKMTNVDSLDEMLSNYMDHEEEMFSLYNFIQSVNTEIDHTKETTLETEEAIAKFRADQQDQDAQRRSVIETLQERLKTTIDTTKELVEENIIQQESISQISKKVSSVFFKLQCDQMDAKGSQVNKSSQRWSTSGARPDSKIALLTSQGVTESNVLDYLGCIEQRAVDIITEYLHLLNVRGENGMGGGDGMNNIIMTATSPGPDGNIYRINTLTGGGARSPTPGPATPMVKSRKEPLVDIDELVDDDFFSSLDMMENIMGTLGSGGGGGNVATLGGGIGGTMTGPTTIIPGGNSNAITSGNNMDHDSKPIDLQAFKTKLMKKLNGKDNTLATAANAATTATGGTVGGSNTMPTPINMGISPYASSSKRSGNGSAK